MAKSGAFTIELEEQQRPCLVAVPLQHRELDQIVEAVDDEQEGAPPSYLLPAPAERWALTLQIDDSGAPA